MDVTRTLRGRWKKLIKVVQASPLEASRKVNNMFLVIWRGVEEVKKDVMIAAMVAKS
jgi:hypothetical protein